MTSSVAVLTVLQTPAIVQQPLSQTNVAGSSATFKVVATGTAPLAWQWLFNGTNLVERASEMIKERPVVAAGAAVAIGLIAFRNPELVTLLARSILAPGTSAGRSDDDGDRPRR